MAVRETAQSPSTDEAELPIPNFIGGEWMRSSTSDALPVHDPGTGQLLGQVPLSTCDDVHAAVAAAKEAFPAWRVTPAVDRVQVLFRLKALLDEHRDDLARELSREHGKNVAETSGEIRRGIENVEHACGIPTLMMGETLEDVARGVDCETVRQPLGVFAGITPYNFPVMIPMWFWPYAVATGNTFVLKPSEQDPLTHQRIVELAVEAGLPSGVLNVVHGDATAADAILEHPDVSGVSFVGSSAVARLVYAKAGQTGKRVQALGGAKNHMVVLPDADLDLAADAAVSAAYGSAGERCMAISVVVAVGDIADDLVERIRVRMDKLVIGPGDDPTSEMEPLITREHRDRVAGYIGSGADEGATVVVDGREQVFDGDGYFLGVSLLDDVTTDMQVYRDEIFGPVLSVVRRDNYHEAVQMIADNPYGNGAAIFTRDGGAARRFQQDAEAGMVGINVPIPVPVGYHSFGGWNDSLFGDTTMYGPEGLRFYTRPKVVTSRWPDPSTSSVDLGFPQND